MRGCAILIRKLRAEQMLNTTAARAAAVPTAVRLYNPKTLAMGCNFCVEKAASEQQVG